MGRKETGFLEDLFRALAETGTVINRTTDFRGNKKAIVYSCQHGTTRKSPLNQGFCGNHADVKVTRNGKEVNRGHIKRNFYGNGIETPEHNSGRVRRFAPRMNSGFCGNRVQTTHCDSYGNKLGEGFGRQRMGFNTYSQEFRGECFRCNGTGIFQPTGQPCRRCGGTGIYRKQK